MKTSFLQFPDPPKWDPAMFGWNNTPQDEQRSFLASLLYAFTDQENNRLNWVKWMRETNQAFTEDIPHGAAHEVREAASAHPDHQG